MKRVRMWFFLLLTDVFGTLEVVFGDWATWALNRWTDVADEKYRDVLRGEADHE